MELRTGDSPLELKIYSRDGAGNWLLVQRPELIAVSTLSPRPGELLGESVLKGLPFVSSVLLKIYNSMGLNWERVGTSGSPLPTSPETETSAPIPRNGRYRSPRSGVRL